MGLLHKNLILAGIASMAMVGFLSSSGASALDGFSFSDIVNRQQAQREQLLSYLSSPFGMNTDCETTNPDSTISCNESPFPNLLYNGISDGEKLWGYDGKGIVFADTDKLINGNSQLRAANRGDTVNVSTEIEAKKFFNEDQTDAILSYQAAFLLSKGLTLSDDGVSVKLSGQDLTENDSYMYFVEDTSDEIASFSQMVIVRIDCSKISYTDDNIFELSISANIADDAFGEVFIRGVYAIDHQNGFTISESDYITNETYQAKALLDGNILIRRVDANGNPLAGAKYTVDGVKAATTVEAGNVFIYDENGAISTFETGSDGYIVITNVPFGTYTVREVQAPQGHETQVEVLTRSNTDDLIDTSYGEETFALSLSEADMNADVTECIDNLQNGKRGLDFPCAMGKFGTSPAALETVATWNEEEQAYTNDGGLRITKEGDSFKMNEFIIPYDSETGKYSTTVTFSEAMKMDGGSDEDLIFNINDNGTATFLYGETTLHYTLNNTTGCYDLVDDVSFGLSFCKDGDNYISKAYEPYDHYLIVVPTDQPGVYKMDYDHMYLTIDVLDDDTVKLGYYFAVMYSEYLNKYLVSLQSTLIGPVPLENSRSHVMAAEYLFQDKTSDAIPEGISNPQTSDAIIKAVIIAVIGLTPIFILRKQLTKRAN